MKTTNITKDTIASTSGTLPPKVRNNTINTKSQSNNINKNPQGNNNSSRLQNRRNNYYTCDKMSKGESTTMNGAVFKIHTEQPPKREISGYFECIKDIFFNDT